MIDSQKNSIFESKCDSCGKKGFLWKRNYCFYCGIVNQKIEIETAKIQRKIIDEMYEQIYIESELIRKRAETHEASLNQDASD